MRKHVRGDCTIEDSDIKLTKHTCKTILMFEKNLDQKRQHQSIKLFHGLIF